MNLDIRPATLDDVPGLAALKRETFRETFVDDGFAIPYPPADVAVFEAASYSEEKVRAEIDDRAHATWVASLDGRLIGYAHVGPCKLPHPEATAAMGELYQLYVRGEAQGLGLGKRLLDIALDHLAATRPGPLWLGVWAGNERAQAVYVKRGFAKVGAYSFFVGEWRDEDHIYRRG